MAVRAKGRTMMPTARERYDDCGPRGAGSQSGQALVELALVLPLLLVLALGVIEIGRFAYISILVGNAARAGSAYGSRGLVQSADTTRIANAAKYDFAGATSGTTNTNGLDQSTLSVSSVNTCGCDSNGTVSPDDTSSCNPSGVPPTCTVGHWVVTIHVTTSGSFNALFNYPGIPASLAVSRTSSMRVAQN